MHVKSGHFEHPFVVRPGPSLTQFCQTLSAPHHLINDSGRGGGGTREAVQTQFCRLNNDSHLIRNAKVLSECKVDSNPPVYEFLTKQCIDLTLIFRFQCEESSNGNFELISLDGIKAGAEQHWELSVGGERELMNINEYIPSNGVEVLFRLVTTTIETVNVDLGMMLKYVIKEKTKYL